MRPLMSMRKALNDPKIFGAILPGESWAAWRILLIAAMGEPLTDEERIIFTELTSRNHEPPARVEEFWAIIGRRGGKTRAIAVLAAYLAALTDFTDILAPGEWASLPILSNTVDQAQKALQYLRGIFDEVPAFKKLVVGQTADSLKISTRVEISVTPANWRSIRGGTAIAIIADEIAIWRSDSIANPDSEVLAAARPCLATTGGMLACISSPYARKGEMWGAYKRDFGPDGDDEILVAKAPSKRMNATLKDSWIKRQYEKDPARSAAEYGANFRTDIESYVSEEAVDACVSEAGRIERPFIPDTRYVAFVDAAGGSGQDSMTLAIAHKEQNIAVLDVVREAKPPFSPSAIVDQFIETLGVYHVKAVTGDRWGGEFVREQFKRVVRYDISEKIKSDIYVELLPLINCRRVDLLDNKRLITQLCNLERRTTRGSGKDVIDHPRDGANAHDDVINAAAGALVLASQGGGRGMVGQITDHMLIEASLPPRNFRPLQHWEIPFYRKRKKETAS